MAYDKISYNKDYNKNNYQRIQVTFNKNDELYNLLKSYSSLHNKSVNSIIIDALHLYFDSIDMPASDKFMKL